VGLGVLVFLAIMPPIWAQQIAVTDQRLIHRRGLVRRSTEELQLRAVEEIRLKQSILGRIFGFGRVVVSGTGQEDVRLPALAAPVKLRCTLREAISMRPIAGRAVRCRWCRRRAARHSAWPRRRGTARAPAPCAFSDSP
jgi:uncharacterized membrane protein YdbT with pleckstrin-like domain